MRAVLRALLFGVGSSIITACDPVYRLGAREQPAPAYSDSCLQRALWATHQFAVVWPLDETAGRGFRLALMQPLSGRDWVGIELRTEGNRGHDAALELTTIWKGFGNSVPVSAQRQFVALATSVLEQLHARCGPATPAQVQCVSDGLGRSAACHSAA